MDKKEERRNEDKKIEEEWKKIREDESELEERKVNWKIEENV